MRVFSLVAVVCTAVAVILSMLSLFAGWRLNFLEDADIMVLDISKLIKNQTGDNTAVVYQQSGPIMAGGTVLTGKNEWYSIHVMNYCQGNYTSDGDRSLEECSRSTAFFSINPISLAGSKTLGPFQVSFSQSISDIGGKIENVYQVLFFFLCAGIAATGLEFMLGVIVAITDARKLTHGTRVSLSNLGLGAIAFLGLGLSSGIITGVLVQAVKKINELGADVGISATEGDKFLWMIWSSTVLMLVVVIVWFMDYYVERKLLLREVEQMYAAGIVDRNIGMRKQSMGPQLGTAVALATAKHRDRFATQVAKDALAHAAGITIAGAVGVPK